MIIQSSQKTSADIFSRYLEADIQSAANGLGILKQAFFAEEFSETSFGRNFPSI
jgi:hypothetical protein